MLSLQSNLGIVAAIVALKARSRDALMADVTLETVDAQNSVTNPPLASDMQSLCVFISSVRSLIGFSISGLLVHLMGAQVCLVSCQYMVSNIVSHILACQILFKEGSWLVQYPLGTGVLSWDSPEGEWRDIF